MKYKWHLCGKKWEESEGKHKITLFFNLNINQNQRIYNYLFTYMIFFFFLLSQPSKYVFEFFRYISSMFWGKLLLQKFHLICFKWGKIFSEQFTFIAWEGNSILFNFFGNMGKEIAIGKLSIFLRTRWPEHGNKLKPKKFHFLVTNNRFVNQIIEFSWLYYMIRGNIMFISFPNKSVVRP